MTDIELTVSVPLADGDLHYSLIRENIPNNEDTALRHIISLSDGDFADLGITTSSQVVIGSPFETQDAVVIKNETVTNGGPITLTRDNFTTSPAYYRLIVKNEVNNNVNYSVSGLIHIVNG